MLRLSAFNPSSSPAVRSLAIHILKLKRDDYKEIENLYRYIPPRDGKWLTRLILKSYAPVEIPDATQILSNHSGLPNMINLRAEFNQLKSAPQLRNGYCGWIRGSDPIETPNVLLPTRPMTVPYPTSSPPPRPGPSQLPKFVSRQATTRINSVTTPKRNKPRKRASHGEPVKSASKYTSENETLSIKPRNSGTISSAPNILNPLDINSPPQRSSALQSIPIGQSGNPLPSTCRRMSRDVEPTLISNAFITSEPGTRRLRRSRGQEFPIMADIVAAGIGTCLLTEKICPLTNCVFLLAPCVASLPLLQELLPHHGARYVSSLSALSDPSIPRRCPRTSKKIRKIALVESHLYDKTLRFMKSIHALELKRPCGKKEWIEVYDYRLLEMVANVDRGIERDSGFNPWQRSWIGAV